MPHNESQHVTIKLPREGLKEVIEVLEEAADETYSVPCRIAANRMAIAIQGERKTK